MPGRRAGYQMSALKAAAELSKRWIADPRSGAGRGRPSHRRRDDGTHAGRRARASTGRGVRNTGGTACLLIADEHGNAVSVVQSVFNVFGAVLLDPQTGILFNNRMQGFTHKPGHPNSVAPGKRPGAYAVPGAGAARRARALRAGDARRHQPDADQRAGASII